jgi:molybdenum cofactor synthesis domain-containing protein
MPRLSGPTAAVLLIGEELLSGKVEDQNARFLVRELRQLGVGLRRIEVVPDEIDEIARAVRALSARFDHVFTSGGVGPTHDDVTMEAVAAAFHMPIARRDELVPLIRAGLGADLHDRDLRMADIPAGARLIQGAAPDPTRWPVVAVNNVYVLPGVPVIFRRKFELLRDLLRAPPIFTCVVGSALGEGPIAATLDTVVAEFPDVAVGSYPQSDPTLFKVKLTLDGRDEARVRAAKGRLATLLGPAVVHLPESR